MSKEIEYRCSSLRFFAEKEHHVTRFCNDDVLLLVYEGVLRFCEDGILYEIHPGEYHIQKHGAFQTGELASDAPKYLYIHFKAEWTDSVDALPKNNTFHYESLRSNMEEMHALSYSDSPYIVKAAKFYEILSKLYKKTTGNTVALQMAGFIQENYQRGVNLDMLCERFAFSKNHIIHIFKKEFGQTPVRYLNTVRLNKAEQLLATTSESIESVACCCGYANYSHFYRQFIDKNRISPEKFRHQKRLGK